MKSLFVVFLALTAIITTAVEAKGPTKKRGLEEDILRYAQQNHEFPLGGPLDLGSVQGIELRSFDTLASSLGSGGLGGQGLTLTGGNLYGASSSLGNIGQYGLGGARLQNLNLLQLQGSRLALQGTSSAPVSIPQFVPSAAAIPQPQTSAGLQFGAKASLPVPISAPIAPTAYPPTDNAQSIPPPVFPPAPLQVYSSTPAASSTAVAVPAPASSQAAAPGNAASGAGRLGSGSLGYTHLGNGVFAIGSGSLGYTSTSSNAAQSNQVQQAQQPQQIIGYAGLQNLQLYGAPQLGLGASFLGQGLGVSSIGQGVGAGYLGQGLGAGYLGQGLGAGYVGQGQGLQLNLGQAQGLQLNLGYDGLQSGNDQLYGVQQVTSGGQGSGLKYTSTLLPGQGQGQGQGQSQNLLQLNPRYGGLPGGTSGLYGASQVQGAGVDQGYGGYSLNNDRSNVGQGVLNSELSGLNLGYGGNIGSLGYAPGATLAQRY